MLNFHKLNIHLFQYTRIESEPSKSQGIPGWYMEKQPNQR